MSEKKFNIFKVARVYANEVLHTLIIAELMNPCGHSKGQDFLNAFLETIGFLKESDAKQEDFEKAKVDSELRTPEGDIDMVISTPKYCIPFEVKIWAQDQERQLERYHKYAETKGTSPFVYYLTPEGRAPSRFGQGELDPERIRHISFKEHILNWLDICVRQGASQDVLVIMQQLRDSIAENITGVMDSEINDPFLVLLRDKLSELGLTATECSQKYLYLTYELNEKDGLAFALRIKMESENNAKFLIICGLKEEKEYNYGKNASDFIKVNSVLFDKLCKATFVSSKIEQIKRNKWERLEESFERPEVTKDEQFADKCSKRIKELLRDILQDDIRSKLNL